jgi:hypothetical protein
MFFGRGELQGDREIYIFLICRRAAYFCIKEKGR